VTEDSFVSVQIFDQKRFKKKGHGFLGLFNFRVGDMIELQKGSG
jgi:E3 ubiquitin-protein ligase NEDD4